MKGQMRAELAPNQSPSTTSWFSNKRLFRFHGWLGLNFGLILFVICFSGAIAALSHEIDWLLNPSIRVRPQAGTKSWSDWHASVADRYKDAHIVSISAPLNRYYAVEVLVNDVDGTTRRVYVNPYTAEVQGSTSYLNVQRFLRSFHMQLFIPRVGLFFVSALAFVLLFSIVSGLLFYKNWRRHIFQLRLRSGQRALWGDVHRLLGIWAFLFSVVIGVTGIWYFVEHALFTTGHGLYIPPPKLSATRLAAHGVSPVPRLVSEYVSAATEALPGLSVRTVSLPEGPDDPVYVDGQSGAWLVRDRANKVFLDPYSAEVLHIQRAEELSPVYRWVDTADPLHFGDFWGVPTKLLWSALGITLPIAILSGAFLSLRRTKSEGSDAAGWTLSMKGGWFGIPRANWLTLAVLVWGTGGAMGEISDYAPQQDPIHYVGQRRAKLGPWVGEALFERMKDDQAGRMTLWLSIQSSAGPASYQSLTVKDATGEMESAGRFRRFSIPGGVRRVLVTAKDWLGQVHVAEFALSENPSATIALQGSWAEGFTSTGALIFILAFCTINIALIVAAVFVFRA